MPTKEEILRVITAANRACGVISNCSFQSEEAYHNACSVRDELSAAVKVLEAKCK